MWFEYIALQRFVVPKCVVLERLHVHQIYLATLVQLTAEEMMRVPHFGTGVPEFCEILIC